jgi:hypothetical protein
MPPLRAAHQRWIYRAEFLRAVRSESKSVRLPSPVQGDGRRLIRS